VELLSSSSLAGALGCPKEGLLKRPRRYTTEASLQSTVANSRPPSGKRSECSLSLQR
jgi:hypothetical protein